MLRNLAVMPFLDRLDLAVVSATADRTTHDAVARLTSNGFVSAIRHATQAVATTPAACTSPRQGCDTSPTPTLRQWTTSSAPTPSPTTGSGSCWDDSTPLPSCTALPP